MLEKRSLRDVSRRVESTPDIPRDELDPAKFDFIAEGSDHLVFEMKDLPQLVFKVDIASLKAIDEIAQKYDWPAGIPVKGMSEAAERVIAQERYRYNQLVQYFGQERVVPQGLQFVRVPPHREVMRALNFSSGSHAPKGFYGIARLQEKVPEMRRDDHAIQLRAQRIEDGRSFPAGAAEPHDYQLITDHFAYGKPWPDTMEDYDVYRMYDRFYLLQEGEGSLLKLNAAFNQNEKSHERIQGALRALVAYANETGEILDIFGSNNIVFRSKNDPVTHEDIWDLLLVDPLFVDGDHVKTLSKAKKLIHGLANGEHLRDQMGSGKYVEGIRLVMNALNFTRLVNGLAESFGCSERVQLISSEDKDAPLNFWKILRGLD